MIHSYMKEILKEDCSNIEYYGFFFSQKYDKIDMLILLNEDYCKNKNKFERLIQFTILEDKILYNVGKESNEKKEFYKKYEKEISELLKLIKKENMLEEIKCETIVKNIRIYVDINRLQLIIDGTPEIIFDYNNVKKITNIYDNFEINSSNKILKKRVKKESHTIEDVMRKIKIEKNKIPIKILKEIESNSITETPQNIKKLQK